MGGRRIGASVLAMTLIVGGCAGTARTRTIQPGNCERAWPCTVVTTELSIERRSELVITLDERIADRTLMAVAYDGEHLRLVPECVIEGRYAWRDAGLEHALDSDSATFLVEDPAGPNDFVRAAEPRRANYRATRRVTLPARVGHKPHDPACREVTHVVEGMIVGVRLEAGHEPRELPVALILDELPVEIRPAPRPERPTNEMITPTTVALAVGAVTLIIVSTALALMPEDAL